MSSSSRASSKLSLISFCITRFDIVKWLEHNGPQGTTTVAPVDAEGKPNGPAVRIHLAGEDDEAIQKLKREADADAKRAQNQLPTWIANSTISGEPAKAADDRKEEEDAKPSIREGATTAAGGVNEPGSPQGEAGDDLDAYYASLAQEGGPNVDSPSAALAGDYLDAASIPLPPSAAQSPLFSPLPTPPTAKDSVSAADEDDFDEATPFEGGERNGKRSRDEIDPGWEEGLHGVEKSDGGGKKARFGSVEVGAVGEQGEEEEDEDDFEEIEEGDGDPNPMIAIGDKLVPFAEVGDELQAAMVSLCPGLPLALSLTFVPRTRRLPKSTPYGALH